MRAQHVLLAVGGVVLIIVLVVVGSTIRQTNEEQAALSADLQYRTRLLADSLKESVEPAYGRNSTAELQKLVDKFANRERLLGLAIYDNRSTSVAASAELPTKLLSNLSIVSDAMDSDKVLGEFMHIDGKSFYVLVEPLHQVDRVIGAFLVAQNAGYIDSGVRKIWESTLFRLILQIVALALIIALLIRWLVVKPVIKMAESLKAARATGRADQMLARIEKNTFFRPLVGEIFKMTKSLSEARSAASEEARLRLEKLDSPWTAERLKEFIKAYLKDRKIFLVSNREPYVHQRGKGGVGWSVPASGMVTALEPVMAACGGLWIAHGSGDADRETADKDGTLAVPPDDHKYTLKRVWLTNEEVQGHYVGFSNEALWPLCHMAHTRPIFRKEDWDEYVRVNRKFADTLLAEMKNVPRPLVLVQDFHFALLPALVKRARPDAQICLFWHVPWPSAEAFSICPWRKELLSGMLGSDLIGFHTQAYCNNFMDTVGKELEALIDLERFAITREEHSTYIKPFPISIALSDVRESEKTAPNRKLLDEFRVKTLYVGLGVDRLDYTKGILERFKAVEVFFERYPEYKGQFTFLQIAPASREGAAKYREYAEAVAKEAERINKKFSAGDWQAIVFRKAHYSHEVLYPLYRLANVCLVTSLHDGMNLVAKEFVAARTDCLGALILSQFTGAARDLKGALIVNPYSAEEVAEALHTALVMPPAEQLQRMSVMRDAVKNYNIYRWSAELIKAVASLG